MRLATFAAAAALTLAAGSAFAQCDPGETVIKFSHVTNADKHPKGLAAALFAQRVNEEMNGKVCVEVFPNSSLYGDDKEMEALLLGDVQMIAPSLSKFEQFTKKFRIFDLPFMFKNMEAVDEFQGTDEIQELKSSMVKRGVMGLRFWHNGLKQFSANKPLLEPEDAKGLKFRVQSSDVLVAQMSALGASPQKMAFSEVYGALQTGVVDGQENTWSNIYGQKFFEVQDGSTETNHGLLDYLVAVNAQWWMGLPEDVRTQISQILDEVTDERNAEVNAVDMAARQAILDAGGVIRELTPEQRKDWVVAMKPVWEQFEKDVSPEFIALAQSINDKH
ncbi:TRAP transporter substrate-binding protein [Paroceanicella profunda]|uniref:TRAP transporter substrate-binding protein n=1 Tax=Paroceanicella profunda TaxID=2579971 RepID=A0A5B8G2L4_9RHOB|nr:TRAP transporter substrate-binding protein [Paroceanicella profunda]QDL93412.1 TRAP transporter substrate-binding protein [Paroceanicella profunda]